MIGFTIFILAAFFLLKGIYSKQDKKEPTKSTYYYEEECNCEEYETEIERIKNNLQDIIINSDDYSKSDILSEIESIL